MIIVIFSVILFLIVLTVVISIYVKKLIPIMIITVFGISSIGMLIVPHYIGYAVDSKFVGGQEATIYSVVEGQDWIYMEVQFVNETEPRLVKIANTKPNKAQADRAKKQAESGLSMMKFGKVSDAAGDGDPNDGLPSARVLTLQETQKYSKPE